MCIVAPFGIQKCSKSFRQIYVMLESLFWCFVVTESLVPHYIAVYTFPLEFVNYFWIFSSSLFIFRRKARESFIIVNKNVQFRLRKNKEKMLLLFPLGLYFLGLVGWFAGDAFSFCARKFWHHWIHSHLSCGETRQIHHCDIEWKEKKTHTREYTLFF